MVELMLVMGSINNGNSMLFSVISVNYYRYTVKSSR
jgi:hypothetical protein